MNIINYVDQVNKKINAVLTIGTFDGLHFGHQNILNEVIEEAKKYKAESVVITFNPHPRSVVNKEEEIKLLTTQTEKERLFAEYGIENLFVIKFTKEFSALSSEEFLTKYVFNQFNVKKIIIGYDHHFGKDRKGSQIILETMAKKHGFGVSVIGEIKSQENKISSTKIRELLLSGEVARASELLKRPYTLEGVVIEGSKRGRELGFPTANVLVNANKLLPQKGVYLIKTKIAEKIFFGMMNIGFRPTFNKEEDILVEVNIFNFNGDLYNQKLNVEILERLREEKKFASAKELIEQINKDKNVSLKMIDKLINLG